MKRTRTLAVDRGKGHVGPRSAFSMSRKNCSNYSICIQCVCSFYIMKHILLLPYHSDHSLSLFFSFALQAGSPRRALLTAGVPSGEVFSALGNGGGGGGAGDSSGGGGGGGSSLSSVGNGGAEPPVPSPWSLPLSSSPITVTLAP